MYVYEKEVLPPPKKKSKNQQVELCIADTFLNKDVKTSFNMKKVNKISSSHN